MSIQKLVKPGLVSIAYLLFLFTNSICPAQQTGEAIYKRNCMMCHGRDERGGNAATLFDNEWRHVKDRESLIQVIEEGIPQVGMPAYGKRFDPSAMTQLADYILSKGQGLGESAAPAIKAKPDLQSETFDYIVNIEHWIPESAGLNVPWAIDWIDPQTALVTERSGALRLIVDGWLDPKPIAGTPAVVAEGQGGMLDVAIDPDYANQPWIYLAYSDAANSGNGAMTRIVRGKIVDHQWTEEQVLYEAKPNQYFNTRHHYGSRIVFDPAGDLYFSIGDRGQRPMAQDLLQPNGKVHRIHRDGTIPADNPFANVAGAVPSIYSYGNRNPQGLAVHPQTGRIWELEHGPRGGDELNVIEPGKNYGWPVISYGINYNGTVLTPERRREDMEQPTYFWRPSLGVCGLDFYTGDRFPYWKGNLLVAGLASRDVRLLLIEDERVMHEEIILRDRRTREAVTGPDGAIYVVVNAPDEILRLTNAGTRKY